MYTFSLYKPEVLLCPEFLAADLLLAVLLTVEASSLRCKIKWQKKSTCMLDIKSIHIPSPNNFFGRVYDMVLESL